MEVLDALDVALKTSQEKFFNVRIVDYDNHSISKHTMSYLQLGTYLMTRCDFIKDVKIKLKRES
jgi:uncharacterized protein YozE (UPF0346 family)